MSRQRQRQKRRILDRATPTPAGLVPVNASALAPYNSYGTPDFLARRAEARKTQVDGVRRKQGV